jgi:hypothetical protein
MPISPIMALDEERKKREEQYRNQMSQVASSFVQSPLTFQKLLEDQEDRKNRLEQAKIKLQQDSEAHTANLDTKAANRDYMAAQAANLDTDNKRIQSGIDQKRQQAAIESVVDAELKNNADDQTILQRSFDHPDLGDVTDQSYVEQVIKQRRDAAAKQEFEQGAKTKGLDIKQQDADTKAAALAARKAARTEAAKNKLGKMAPTRLPAHFAKELTEIRKTRSSVAGIIERKKKVDTGLVSTFGAKVRGWAKLPEKDRHVFDQEVQRLFNQIVKNQSGATVTAQEMTRQLAAFPDRWTDDEIFDAALDALAEELQEEETAILDAYQAIPIFSDVVGETRANLEKTPLPGANRGKEEKPKLSDKDMILKKRIGELKSSGVSKEEARAILKKEGLI